MDIERFKLIIYDTFKLDMVMLPKFNKRNICQFNKQSYYVWSLEELIKYVSKRIYHGCNATIEEYRTMVLNFRKKMGCYRKYNDSIFKVSCDMADDVLDLLNAMK